MKKVKKKNVIIIAVICIVVGFLIGEMLPLPIFDNINLRATIMRPRDVHKRSSF